MYGLDNNMYASMWPKDVSILVAKSNKKGDDHIHLYPCIHARASITML